MPPVARRFSGGGRLSTRPKLRAAASRNAPQSGPETNPNRARSNWRFSTSGGCRNPLAGEVVVVTTLDPRKAGIVVIGIDKKLSKYPCGLEPEYALRCYLKEPSMLSKNGRFPSVFCLKTARKREARKGVVGPGELESPTSPLSGECSNQLSYEPVPKETIPPSRARRNRA